MADLTTTVRRWADRLMFKTKDKRPVVLIYRGPASLSGCPESVAAALAASKWDFDIRFVGPKESHDLGAETLAKAAMYVQPGGGSLSSAYKHLKQHRKAIRGFVRSGGVYLGFCLGGYLAGATPGFGLLPGDAGRYISSADATLKSDNKYLVRVDWRGRKRLLFFEDGPYFWLNDNTSATVLARYPNQKIAAMVVDFGRGRVGVVGPHPEASDKWFTDLGLSRPEKSSQDLALDLVDTVMTR